MRQEICCNFCMYYFCCSNPSWQIWVSLSYHYRKFVSVPNISEVCSQYVYGHTESGHPMGSAMRCFDFSFLLKIRHMINDSELVYNHHLHYAPNTCAGQIIRNLYSLRMRSRSHMMFNLLYSLSWRSRNKAAIWTLTGSCCTIFLSPSNRNCKFGCLRRRGASLQCQCAQSRTAQRSSFLLSWVVVSVLMLQTSFNGLFWPHCLVLAFLAETRRITPVRTFIIYSRVLGVDGVYFWAGTSCFTTVVWVSNV